MGPFRITRLKSPVSYELDLPESLSRKFPSFHADQLRRYFVSDELDFPVTPQSNLHPPDPEYLVQEITDVDLDKEETTLMFKIKWASPYDSDAKDSWVPLSNVDDTVALDCFLCTDGWKRFTASRDFRSFKRRYPDRIPKHPDGF